VDNSIAILLVQNLIKSEHNPHLIVITQGAISESASWTTNKYKTLTENYFLNYNEHNHTQERIRMGE